MDASLIDVVLVVSLSFLAISFLVFIMFFVPVLIQITKTLESAQALIDLLKDYSQGISNEMQKVSNGLSHTVSGVSQQLSKAGGLVASIILSLRDMLKSSKSRW